MCLTSAYAIIASKQSQSLVNVSWTIVYFCGTISVMKFQYVICKYSKLQAVSYLVTIRYSLIDLLLEYKSPQMKIIAFWGVINSLYILFIGFKAHQCDITILLYCVLVSCRPRQICKEKASQSDLLMNMWRRCHFGGHPRLAVMSDRSSVSLLDFRVSIIIIIIIVIPFTS